MYLANWGPTERASKEEEALSWASPTVPDSRPTADPHSSATSTEEYTIASLFR